MGWMSIGENRFLPPTLIGKVHVKSFSTPTYQLLREQIRADIISGLWALGTHVTIAQLSKHYDVSANPVREALLQLQGEGVIDMRMNRGALVPVVDVAYVNNVCRLRGAVQSMLAREAARLATPEQIAQMKALAEAHEAAAATADTAACVTANRALHHYIDSLARNPQAKDVLDSRASLMDASRRSLGYQPGRLDVVIAQHRKLVRAIARGDQDKAALASLEHTETARVDLVAMLSSKR